MNRVNDLIEKVELMKAAYFSGLDFDSRYNYIIGGIEANDIRIMYDEGKQNIDELVSALEELATLKPELDSYRLSIYLVGREGMRANIVNKLMSRGSVSGVDEKGKTVYNGIVENNSRLDIVIGLPASGKSSAIVNAISTEYKSRLIDNDEAKKEIPEYNDGWGSGLVHSESQLIERKMLEDSLKSGENIVYPKVGSNYQKLMSIISLANKYGYTVNVHYVELNRNKALGRMINRFIDDGRFLEPKLIDKYDNLIDGNKIAKTYEMLKEGGVVKGFSKWDNDVEKGKEPILIETNCEGRLFGTKNMESTKTENSKSVNTIVNKLKKPKAR